MGSYRKPEAEDTILKDLISVYGNKRGRPSESSWGMVSKHLPGRTDKDCRKRWLHSLDPTLRKGRWTPAEDAIILESYQRLGPAWKEIALLLRGRKDDQVAKRYKDILSPSVKDRLLDWTPAEDRHLTAQVAKFGHKWTAISMGLSGRPPLTCRNRWHALRRAAEKAKNRNSQSESCVSEDALSSDITMTDDRSRLETPTGLNMQFNFPCDAMNSSVYVSDDAELLPTNLDFPLSNFQQSQVDNTDGSAQVLQSTDSSHSPFLIHLTLLTSDLDPTLNELDSFTAQISASDEYFQEPTLQFDNISLDPTSQISPSRQFGYTSVE